ncbi:MAG TPA: carbohydrate ABC transporter permease [Anaeromyxobacter sp.]|nr:carbohydrate ABC transporter permease [Anaeromyxobacter sp.]
MTARTWQRPRLASHLVLGFSTVVMIYPVMWVVMSSLKTPRDLYGDPWGLPRTPRLANYSEAWKIGRIGESYLNSILVAVASLALILVVSYLAAYALARLRFRGRNLVMVLFVSTMLLPVQATIIPIYKIEQSLNLIDTLPGLVLPYVAKALPFTVFVLTAFIKTIPTEFDEAARLDGAGRLRILWSVLVPLTRPALASVVILDFMTIWNDFYLPLVLIHDPARRTLNLGLVNFQQLWGRTDFTRLFAALVLINVPLIVVYVVFQRQFINGMTSGGLKA